MDAKPQLELVVTDTVGKVL